MIVLPQVKTRKVCGMEGAVSKTVIYKGRKKDSRAVDKTDTLKSIFMVLRVIGACACKVCACKPLAYFMEASGNIIKTTMRPDKMSNDGSSTIAKSWALVMGSERITFSNAWARVNQSEVFRVDSLKKYKHTKMKAEFSPQKTKMLERLKGFGPLRCGTFLATFFIKRGNRAKPLLMKVLTTKLRAPPTNKRVKNSAPLTGGVADTAGECRAGKRSVGRNKFARVMARIHNDGVVGRGCVVGIQREKPSSTRGLTTNTATAQRTTPP
ncbi:hypothetical protein BEN30_11915 [Magnetovibrio blakemorei]|uniref:Uncharacterized protein n=1 Tax=Magnetovibrio blakemorei TaxID=28181 RepID=A0A1E5Q6Q2_9PROT|nr:hypothetical protein BEN30_11915 [Magnetovibrio blakemorei]